MFSDHLLRVTLAVSILVHGAIFLRSPGLNPFRPAPKIQKIAVRYIKETPQAKPLLKNLSALDRQELVPKAGARRLSLPYIEPGDVKGLPNSHKLESRGLAFTSQSPPPAGFTKPAFINSEVMAIKKKITLPEIEMARIDNPSYINYYQIVREKIRRSAYQNYMYIETGQVYVSFIISNYGGLMDARLAEERTTANDYLKNIALKSVREAAPFPNFPKELDYPQLSFNIIISFEME
ncbi:MAG: energy transducer TonB [Candidatus Omnitrophota bacterium]